MMYFEIDSYSGLKRALLCLCTAFEEEGVPDGTVFDSKLAVHELVVNALRYGGGKAYVTAERSGREIKIWVRSEISFRPPERTLCPEGDAERGRGLFLVDSVSEERSYSEAEGICIVIRMKTK